MSDYHGRIMNIAADGVSTQYKLGHRDARHAAAEIATKADAEIAALRADRDRLRDALEPFASDMHHGGWRAQAGEDFTVLVPMSQLRRARAALTQSRETSK